MSTQEFQMQCPIPSGPKSDLISLGHGGGGALMRRFIRDEISLLYSENEAPNLDSALLKLTHHELAFTSDSFVVDPIFFPGGDIGKLAVYGTCNDLAMVGARPKYISLSFIIEEGLSFNCLRKILDSIRTCSEECGVSIVTGDTKVVPRGKADKIYINTTGIGEVVGEKIDFSHLEPGDCLLLSGDIGRHSTAVMAARENFIESLDLISDCASLYPGVAALLKASIPVKGMRDLTRGGLGAALHEITQDRKIQVTVRESQIPVHPQVKSYCEILGLEPYFLANEGCFLAIVPANHAQEAADILRVKGFSDATIIGEIKTTVAGGGVLIETEWGSHRRLPEQMGELLPRIC